MVFEGWNIFSKQNKEGGRVHLAFAHLMWPNPHLEIWITYVNRKQGYKTYTKNFLPP